MNKMNETYNKVVEIIANQFELNKETLSPETRLREDLQADSISVMEMVLSFEEQFNLTISDEVFENIQTIQDVVSYIDEK